MRNTDGHDVGLGGDDGPSANAPTPGRVRRSFGWVGRHRRGIGVLVVVAAAFGGGFTLGWTLRDGDGAVSEQVLVNVDRPVVAVGGAAVAADAAPNVLGLALDDARQALIDAGVDPTEIDTSEVPTAGRAGVVVVQDPPPGIPVADGVVLGMSVAATVPDVAGGSVDDARDRFDQLGAVVRVVRRYDPSAAEGTVLGVSPPTGERLPTSVELTVASAPSSVFITDLDDIEGSCSSTSGSVNGTGFDTGLECGPRDDFAQATWLLDRRISRFETTVGIEDASDSGSTVEWAVLGDDRVLAAGTAGYGQAEPIALDVTGVLRFTVRYRLAELPDGVSRPDLVFANPLLIGGPDDIDALLAED